MKTLILMFILFTGYTFSQDKIFEAKVANPEQIQESKTKGEFKFIFPKQTKKEVLEKNAAFYNEYFTVKYDESNQIVTLKMVVNDEKSRQIIKRFMVSNKINQIEMGGSFFKLDDFYIKYLK